MDGAGALAERAGVAVGENGLHLGHDGEGDLFGRVGPEVEADGRMKAGAHFSRDCQAIAREIGEDAFGAFFRTEQAEAMPLGSKEDVEKRPERSQIYVRTYRRHLTPLPWGSAKACDGRRAAAT